CSNITPILFTILFPLFFTRTAPTLYHPRSLHDALPILLSGRNLPHSAPLGISAMSAAPAIFFALSYNLSAVVTTSASFFSIRKRSEEHTSELQSRFDLVCRLLLEKKNNNIRLHTMFVTI